MKLYKFDRTLLDQDAMSTNVETLKCSDSEPLFTIEARRALDTSDLRSLWSHRDLLWHLVWRDLKALHVNSGLGMLWIVLQPLATTFVLTLFLGVFVKVPPHGLPHAVVVLSGLVAWTYFSATVSKSATSLIANSYLLKKVYFPRVIYPIVQMLVGLVDFGVLLGVLAGVCIYFGFYPQWSWLAVIVPFGLNFLLVLGVSLWLSALNIRYRDIGVFLPVILQLAMYLSPVIYVTSLVPEPYRELYMWNPLVGVIDSLRWCLFRVQDFPGGAIVYTFTISLFLIVSGYVVFRKMEDQFADIV